MEVFTSLCECESEGHRIKTGYLIDGQDLSARSVVWTDGVVTHRGEKTTRVRAQLEAHEEFVRRGGESKFIGTLKQAVELEEKHGIDALDIMSRAASGELQPENLPPELRAEVEKHIRRRLEEEDS